MVKAHFFDLDTIISINNQAWIVDKKNPNVPLMKISKSDFNLIKSGIYRKQNNKVEFNGKVFWLPTDLVNRIKVKAKNYKTEFSNLVISLQEFMNPDVTKHLEFDLNLDIFESLKNKVEDIYIICSKQSKRNYESMIHKLEEQLKKQGILVKNFYYISENFYNQNDDDIKFKKLRLLIQHLMGYRTEGNKFIDKQITRYSQIEYYDNNYDTLNYAQDINSLLEIIVSNTENGLRDVIVEDLRDFKPSLIVNKVNENKFNKVESKKVILNLSKIIKTFESFKLRK